MPEFSHDVLTIGNAIVDILARSEDAFIERLGVTKGMMRLIDAEEAERLYAQIGPAVEASGGSAGNTAAGIASFGGRAAYIGKVAKDQLGAIFRHDITALGVRFPTEPLVGGDPTARSFILITPDGERTMNTYLGACTELGEADIDEATVAAAGCTYLEGYLWDKPAAKAAFRKAAAIAHANGRTVALSLSDSFCVDRWRAEFLELIRGRTVDLVFANESEVKALYETDDVGAAIERLRADAAFAAVTLGARGAMAIRGTETASAPAGAVETVVDLTGAGDQFAAGFLMGLARGRTLGEATALGCLAGTEVIGHVGPRPAVSLKALAAKAGLAL